MQPSLNHFQETDQIYSLNVSNLNTNKKNTLTTLEQATAEKFRLMGKAAAQKAIHAYTAAFNEELATLTED